MISKSLNHNIALHTLNAAYLAEDEKLYVCEGLRGGLKYAILSIQ